MFGRHLFTLCVLATVFLASVKAEEESDLTANLVHYSDRSDVEVFEGTTIEERNQIIDAIIEFLEESFAWAAKNCLKEVAKNCKKHWWNPKKLVKCAKKYFKEHEGECAIPDMRGEIMDLELLDDESSIDAVESRNPALKLAMKIIQKAFAWAAKHCVKEAAEHCKSNWNHPIKLIDCAKKFFKVNKGRCALG